ncbi:PMEI domain-containing protein [Heracleum sosnowskyi]|uniref:PMEI domain-containing protein n=1 Tax=Heracleum sosnowskyi TaxID=360622 RepID=A0AAD8N2S3_9APIA|nr:PMEI domain-containing protein [Heracleum sosnowskyi]
MEMSRSALLFSALLLFLTYTTAPASSAAAAPANKYIKTSCTMTTYPLVCEQSLSAYAKTIQNNPQLLASIALQVSLNRTKVAQTFMNRLGKFKGLKPRQYGAIHDCKEEVEDSLDRVSRSCDEMKDLGRAKGNEFSFRMSNVETWVSAALTDETTCMDGFAGKGMDGKIKESVRAQVVAVARVTSNALALVNNFAAKHKN